MLGAVEDARDLQDLEAGIDTLEEPGRGAEELDRAELQPLDHAGYLAELPGGVEFGLDAAAGQFLDLPLVGPDELVQRVVGDDDRELHGVFLRRGRIDPAEKRHRGDDDGWNPEHRPTGYPHALPPMNRIRVLDCPAARVTAAFPGAGPIVA